MDEEIKKMLGEEIKARLSNLSSLDADSKERSEAVDDLVKLYKLRIEEVKTELDYKKEIDEHERNDQTKKEQLSEQRKDRWLKLGITTAELIFYGIWMYKGFRFEEKGTICSSVFKDLIRHFSPSKK